MPKAGRYDYPARDLDDCVMYLEKAHKVANAFVISRENFAKDIGLSPKGGGFGLTLSSMSMYGLIETGDGNIHYTDLVQKILFGQPQERADSKNTAIRKVTLFGDIFDRYGSNPTDDQIRHLLREKAEVPISEEAKVAFDVGKLLKRNVPHLKPVGGGNKEMDNKTVTLAGSSALLTLTARNVNIQVDDRISLGLAKKLLEDIEKELENRDKTSKKDQKDQSK